MPEYWKDYPHLYAEEDVPEEESWGDVLVRESGWRIVVDLEEEEEDMEWAAESRDVWTEEEHEEELADLLADHADEDLWTETLKNAPPDTEDNPPPGDLDCAARWFYNGFVYYYLAQTQSEGVNYAEV